MADSIDNIDGIPSAGVAVVAEPPHGAATTSPGSPSKRARAEGQDLGLAWIAAALGGAVVIFGFTVAGLAHWSASAMPVLFMAGYLWFAMSRSRRSVQRFVEGTNKTLTDQTQKFSQTAQTEIAAMLNSLTELRKATGRIQKSVEKHGNDLDSSVGALTTSLLSSSQRSKDAMDGLLGKIDLIEAPADLIDRKLKAMTAGVESSLTATRQQLDTTTSSLAHLETAAGKSLSALTQLPESIRAIDAALDAAARHLATLTEGAVGRVNADFASLTDDIRTAKQSLGTVATGVNEMIKFVDSRLR